MITCVFVLVQKLTVNVLLYNSGGDCLHQNEKKKSQCGKILKFNTTIYERGKTDTLTHKYMISHSTVVVQPLK